MRIYDWICREMRRDPQEKIRVIPSSIWVDRQRDLHISYGPAELCRETNESGSLRGFLSSDQTSVKEIDSLLFSIEF